MRNPDETDAELAVRAAAGDGDAFGTLVSRYAPAARRVARAVVANPDDADDAAQDGFLLAWRAVDRFDPTRPFGPWLMRIVMNAARDLRRRRTVRRTDPLPAGDIAGGLAAVAAGAGPDRETARTLFRERLAEALGSLAERQRLAVTLFDVEGYGHAEIAAMLGVAEGTVRSDVFHARRALRRALAPYLEESL